MQKREGGRNEEEDEGLRIGSSLIDRGDALIGKNNSLPQLQ
jgi:hypothetical protein